MEAHCQSLAALGDSIESLPALAEMVKEFRGHQTAMAESLATMSLQLGSVINRIQHVQVHGPRMHAAGAGKAGWATSNVPDSVSRPSGVQPPWSQTMPAGKGSSPEPVTFGTAARPPHAPGGNGNLFE